MRWRTGAKIKNLAALGHEPNGDTGRQPLSFAVEFPVERVRRQSVEAARQCSYNTSDNVPTREPDAGHTNMQ